MGQVALITYYNHSLYKANIYTPRGRRLEINPYHRHYSNLLNSNSTFVTDKNYFYLNYPLPRPHARLCLSYKCISHLTVTRFICLQLTISCSPLAGVIVLPSGFGALGSTEGAKQNRNMSYDIISQCSSHYSKS